VFQPHLFSRTRDFAEGFSEALSLADEVYLLDIYPARELPIDGVDSNLILKSVTSHEKRVVTREEILTIIASNPPQVLMTLGAGDIDQLISPIRNLLTKS
jgi:UDP-N-acetylmuramate--alanine ligase